MDPSLVQTLIESQSRISGVLQAMEARLGKLEAGHDHHTNSDSQSDYEDNDPWPELSQPRSSVTKQVAQQMVSRLESSPSGTQVEELRKSITRFKGVPETPVPTRKPEDLRLHNCQCIVEDSIHKLLAMNEYPSNSGLHAGHLLALLRRLFEDLNEMRRFQFARGATHVLERVTNAPHLLSKEEEKALASSRRNRRSRS